MTKNSNVLMHHGVKGMHWGIRRYEPYPSGHKGGKEVGEAAKAKKRKVAKIAAGVAGAATLAAGGVAVADRIRNSKSKKKNSSDRITAGDGVWTRDKKQGKDKAPTSSAEQLARGVDTITKETTRVGNRIIDRVENRARQKDTINRAKGKSDEELRKTVNRIRLEREYNSLTAPEISKGYSTARNILETIGSISTIGLAATGIYATIKNLK